MFINKRITFINIRDLTSLQYQDFNYWLVNWTIYISLQKTQYWISWRNKTSTSYTELPMQNHCEIFILKEKTNSMASSLPERQINFIISILYYSIHVNDIQSMTLAYPPPPILEHIHPGARKNFNYNSKDGS